MDTNKLTALLLDSPDLDRINPKIKEGISVSIYFTNLHVAPPAGAQFGTRFSFEFW
jgi:hypothetical protein